MFIKGIIMKKIINIVLAFICTILFPTFISDTTLSFSNSHFSVILLVLLFLLFQYTSKQSYSRRLLKFTYVLGFIFSCMTAFGYSLEAMGTVHYSSMALIISIFLYAHVYAMVLSIIWSYLEKNEMNLQQGGEKYKWYNKIITWIFEHPYVIAILLLVCWMPCYISTFPGGFRYDAEAEFNQVLNGYNGNFPLLHTVLITRILSVGYQLTGSYNTGIAFYTIVQMILIALMYTQILCKFYKQQVSRIVLGIGFLYCSFFPVIQMLVTQTVRDVLFSALLTYAMFLFYLLSSEKEEFLKTITKPLVLGIIFVLTLLARNNNAGSVMLIIVFAVSLLVWILTRKVNLRGATIFLITSIGSYLLLGAGLTFLCQPLTPAETGQSLSVLSQPIVRAYLTESDTWTNEEKAEFATYFNMEGLTYVSENADPTKHRLMIDENMSDFLLFWCKIGIKHPGCYLDAILDNTKQMWFPGCIVDGYNETGLYEAYDKCYYSFHEQIEKPGTHMQYFSKVREFYTNIGLYISFERVPVISMLFSIGFQFWLLLNTVFYIVYRRCRHLYLPLTIIMGYTIISAFVPLVLLRYFAAIFFAFPMILVFTLQPSVLLNTSAGAEGKLL